jgi:hypothetical protein
MKNKKKRIELAVVLVCILALISRVFTHPMLTQIAMVRDSFETFQVR